MALLGLALPSIAAMVLFAKSRVPAHKVVTLLIWSVTAAWSLGVRL